jgi:hypothetical protein
MLETVCSGKYGKSSSEEIRELYTIQFTFAAGRGKRDASGPAARSSGISSGAQRQTLSQEVSLVVLTARHNFRNPKKHQSYINMSTVIARFGPKCANISVQTYFNKLSHISRRFVMGSLV